MGKRNQREDALANEIDGLTLREQLFCYAYIANGQKASEAATAAGYVYASKNTLGMTAGRLLVREDIKKRLGELSKRASDEAGIQPVEVLSRLANLARSNVKNLFDSRGKLRNICDLPDDIAETISSIEVVTKTMPSGGEPVEVEYVHKFKFWDKVKSLELTGKTHALFVDRIEETVKHEFADITDDQLAAVIAGLATQGAVCELLERVAPQGVGQKDRSDVPRKRAATT